MKLSESDKIKLKKIYEEIEKGATFTLNNGSSGFCLTEEMNTLLAQIIKSRLQTNPKKNDTALCETTDKFKLSDEALYRIYAKLFKEGGIHEKIKK